MHTASSSAAASAALHVNYLSVDALRPDPRNARRHSPRQIKLLARSIEAFGFNVPILVDANHTVLAGHARLAAARKLGQREVPTIQLSHLRPDQAAAFEIADNRLSELATWDEALLAEQLKALTLVDLTFDIEATGFSVGEIDLRIESLVDQPGIAAQADPADHDLPTVQATPVTQPGDLWQLGPHRLLCGSALVADDFERLMAGQRAAQVFCDPPYNVPIDGFVGGKGRIAHREFVMASGELSEREFEAFLSSTMRHLCAHSEEGALHYLCMDWRHLEVLLRAGNGCYPQLKNLCVWVKDRAGMGSLYRSQHELIAVFKHGRGRHRNNVELGRNGRHRSNVWSYPSIASSRRGEEGDLLALHPTVKPVRLIADALLDASARGEIVLDPFLGSGSTLIACQRVGRISYGMELDPRYVDVAIRRWQRDTGQCAVHEPSGETFAQREARGRTPEHAQADSSAAPVRAGLAEADHDA